MSSTSFPPTSPRSFTQAEILREGSNGEIKLYNHLDGRIIVWNAPKVKTPVQIRLDDTYAVFQNGPDLKVETCPRVVNRSWAIFGGKTARLPNPFKRVCKTHVLRFANDIEAKEWYDEIKAEVTPSYAEPLVENGPARKLLVVVNPIGGKGKGEQIFRELLKPMLDDCGTPHELIVTNAPGHAEKIAKSFSLLEIGAIAVVGGDGLFGEILNGINAREDRGAVLAIPIGVVPAGSSNCLACSVGLRQPLAAAFAVARGILKPLDVLKVTLAGDGSETATPRVVLSVCGVSYGFISEVNTFAGKWRWLFGPTRYTVCGARTILASPMTYHVDCRYLPPVEDHPEFDKTECGPDCKACASHIDTRSRQPDGELDSVSPMSPSVDYIRNSVSTCISATSPLSAEAPPSVLTDEKPTTPTGPTSPTGAAGWVDSAVLMEPRRRGLKPKAKSIDSSSLLLFSLTNLSIRQSQNYTVWNANCHMASGYMDMVLMPVMTRLQLLKFLNKYAKCNDTHKENTNVFSVVKAKSVEMKITNTDEFPEWEKAIQLAIDGETYPLQPLRVDTLHGLLNFMCC